MKEISKEEKLKCLNDLLINANDFNKILKYQNDINIFKILKTEKTEIRHSNILAWLLNSAENHKLDDLFCKTFFGKIAKDNYNIIKDNFSIHKLILHSLTNFIVYREKWNIDILLVAEKSKQVVVIENKIESGEHNNQLKRYEDIIDQEFPNSNYEKLFIYLTPNLSEELNNNRWIKVGYETIKDSLEEIQYSIKDEVVKLILNNYIDIIRSEVMEDDSELKNVSLEIYNKYKIALDTIFEYKPDLQENLESLVEDVLMNYGNENKIIVLPSTKSYIRFTTKTLKIRSQAQGNEKWIKGEKEILVYEIVNLQNYELYIKLMVGPSNNLELRNSIIEIAKNNKIFKNLTRGNEWTQIWKKTILTKNEIENEDFNIDKIKEKLTININKIINNEIEEIDEIFNQN